MVMSDNPYEAAGDFAARPTRRSHSVVVLRGVAGGVVGGVLGFFVFQWLARQGMYGMMIPGAGGGVGGGVGRGWEERGFGGDMCRGCAGAFDLCGVVDVAVCG